MGVNVRIERALPELAGVSGTTTRVAIGSSKSGWMSSNSGIAIATPDCDSYIEQTGASERAQTVAEQTVLFDVPVIGRPHIENPRGLVKMTALCGKEFEHRATGTASEEVSCMGVTLDFGTQYPEQVTRLARSIASMARSR
jgi:hypothetical protein